MRETGPTTGAPFGSALDRRSFLATTAALGAAALWPVACQTTPARPRRAAGEPLRLGIVGVANQGGANLEKVSSEKIVALCDVDADYLAAAGARFSDAKRFRDFRELLADPALDLDGVVISTPDHTHAPAASLALRRGLGVYLEKPLTHTIEECRALAALARANSCVTQMGTLIHAGNNYRRVVEFIRSGAIGRTTQVDCWCPKAWCCGQRTPGAAAPARLDWTLWQGPIPESDYIEGIAPANWRSYWKYGTGTLGDMGCHILDLPFWALELDGPRGDRVTATADGPALEAVGCPKWVEATWVFPDAVPNGADPLILRWFDGGRVPPTVQELGGKDKQDYFGRFSVCFQGTKGFLMANYDEMLVLQVPDAVTPPTSIPNSLGHHREWLDALRQGATTGNGSPLCGFEYAAPLTELVLLGTVAYRTQRAVEWNRRASLGSLDPTLRAALTEPYRAEWEF
ncbi:MAG: Gfo/Idh/MocA family oxidoreductase [Phycisphaerae bacterium]|nr:Gfo/Idh/MocA family oxidoreductase [Phycisphaerae bacterium]